ncbi:MAG: hypothetical protein IJA69_02000 [Clostridia bacterium]|nr:hypothetical protein [Clostridia bacterium]
MIYKKEKRIFDIFFVMIYCISFFLCCFIFIDKPLQNWQDFASYDFEQEQITNERGEVEYVNLISTPEQLVGFFKIVNNRVALADDYTTNTTLSSKTYKLNNDINLSGKSWTSSALASGYVFDANNFTISNLTISVSSGENIGFVSKNAGTIKNLFLKNPKINYNASSATNVGTIAGSMSGGKIENCSVINLNAGITAKSSIDYLVANGGIVGKLSGGTVTKCYNNSIISNGRYVGGIVGYQTGGEISYCYNYSAIKSTYKNINCVGGICGYASSGEISLCYNSGAITSTPSDSTENEVCAAGIVGKSGISISECYNVGAVTAGSASYSKYSYAGGICGKTTQLISNCGNRGKIIAYAYENVGDPVACTLKQTSGGLVAVPFSGGGGDSDSGSTGDSTTGSGSTDYTSEKTTSEKYAYAGGIAGYSSSSASYCYNTGSTTGGYKKNSFTLTHTAGYERINGTTRDVLIIRDTYTGSASFTLLVYASDIIGNTYAHTSCYGVATKLPSDFTLAYSSTVDHTSTSGHSQFNGNYSKSLSNQGYNTWSDSGVTNGIATVSHQVNMHGTMLGYYVYPSTNMEISYSSTNFKIVYSYEYKSGYGATATTKSQTLVNESYERKQFENIVTESHIKNNLLSDSWAVSSTKNKGFPYIKDLYW